MKNFFITGIGRSGTKFLSKQMNRSKLWTVMQETPGDKRILQGNKDYLEEVKRRFRREFYGEVNWYILSMTKMLKVDKRGLIIRDPVDIWVSLNNRRINGIRDIKIFDKMIRKLAGLACDGDYQIIKFSKMITDISYLQNIIEEFDIKDVQITEEMFDRRWNVNPDHKKRFKSITDFSKNIQKTVGQWRELLLPWLEEAS